jgi:hypothetical protein
MAIYPQQLNDWLLAQIPKDAVASGKELDFQGASENVGGELVNIPVIYGYRRITGPRVYTSTKAGNSKILYTAVAIGEGPITKIHKLFINDEQVLIADSGDGGGAQVTQGTYGGILDYEIFFGNRTYNTITGTNSGPISDLLTEITGNAQDIRQFSASMAGIAYIVLKMNYVDQNSPYKNFPKITVEVSGRKLRNASTAGYGTEANVFQDANPADVLLDYLTNTNYGRGMDASKIDFTSISALRSSLAFTIIPFTNGAATPRAKCNYILETGRTVLDNVKDLCRQFGVVITLANGLYRFTPEYKTSTVVMTITNSHILNGYSITIPDLSVKFNRVSVSFPNSLDSFNQSVETMEDAAAISSDGKILDVTVDYSATTDPYQARNNAQTLLLKSRNQKTYNFTMTKEALRLTVGDVVIWDPENTEISTTYVRIISMSMNPDFTFAITAVTHADSFYPQFTAGSSAQKRIEIVPTAGGIVIQPTPTVPATVTATQAPLPIIGPPPPLPVVPQRRKVTLAGITALPDTLPNSENFYPVPIEKFANVNTTVADANYRLATSQTFSQNSANFGNYTAVNSMSGGRYSNYFYDYRPALFYRERDLGNESLGGEGLLIGNGGIVYNKIYYVYEIDTSGSIGWINFFPSPQDNIYERFTFDPQRSTDGLVSFFRPDKPTTSETIRLLDCYQGTEGPNGSQSATSRSLYGCPFLVYNRSVGCYLVPNGDLGLRYFLKVSDTRLPRNWVIPGLQGKDVWTSKQNKTPPGTSAEKMQIKYFVVNPNSGQHQFLCAYSLNLDDRIPGLQTQTLLSSQQNWKAAKGQTGVPF